MTSTNEDNIHTTSTNEEKIYTTFTQQCNEVVKSDNFAFFPIIDGNDRSSTYDVLAHISLIRNTKWKCQIPPYQLPSLYSSVVSELVPQVLTTVVL